MKYYEKRTLELNDINRGKITLNWEQIQALNHRFPYHIEYKGDILQHEQTLALDEALYTTGSGELIHFVHDWEDRLLHEISTRETAKRIKY